MTTTEQRSVEEDSEEDEEPLSKRCVGNKHKTSARGNLAREKLARKEPEHKKAEPKEKPKKAEPKEKPMKAETKEKSKKAERKKCVKDEKVDEEDAAVWEAKSAEIDSVSDAAGVKEALLLLGGEVAMVDEFLASLPEAPSGDQACSMAVGGFFCLAGGQGESYQPAYVVSDRARGGGDVRLLGIEFSRASMSSRGHARL